MRPIAVKTLLLFICLAIVGVGTTRSQSGRRQNKTPELAPVPTPTPEPTPQPKAKAKQSEYGFLIGADRSSTYMNFYGSDYDAVLLGCSERLRDGSAAFVDVSRQDMNRSDAIKKAKADKTTYVVLLSLQMAPMARSNNEIEVEYVVFAPVTGKIATNGRTYPNGRRAGPVVVGPSSTSGMYREQLLRIAGEDAGDRILKSLHLSTEGTVIQN